MSKAQKGINDLQSKRPDLADEWNYEKNIDCLLSEIAINSNRIVWWKGKCGHEWEACVYNRSHRGAGCPYCNGSRVLSGYNDLFTVKPEARTEWDFDKNTGLDPEKCSSGSKRVAWWICSKNHSYQQPIYRHKANHCPICARETQTSFPEQAVVFYMEQCTEVINRWKPDKYEIDIYLPKLSIGIEYDGEYYHRSKAAEKREENKRNAFDKIGIKVIRIKETKENVDLYQKNDVILYKPTSDYSSLNQVIIHLLNSLNMQLPEKKSVDVQKDQNYILERYAASVKERSIAKRCPSLINEWLLEKNLLSPDQVSAGSTKKFWWKCEYGHEWMAPPYSRASGNGCPYCSGLLLIEGKNDLLSQNPVLAKEWNYDRNKGLMPNAISVNNGKKVWWYCPKCGYEWQASVAHRNNGKGCPTCGNKNRGKNNVRSRVKKNGMLFNYHPELLEEWDFEMNSEISPSEITEHSGKKAWWICGTCGYKWEAYISNRAKGHGCPKCAAKSRAIIQRQRRVDEIGSILQTHPDIAKQWDCEKNSPWKPTDFTYGSSKKVWWICPSGHSFASIISNRCTKGRGCTICANIQRRKNIK